MPLSILPDMLQIIAPYAGDDVIFQYIASLPKIAVENLPKHERTCSICLVAYDARRVHDHFDINHDIELSGLQ